MKAAKIVLFVADAPGFYNGGRVRKDGEFSAPFNEKFSWAHIKGDVKEEAALAEPSLLDKNVRDILAELPKLNRKELLALQSEEQASASPRKTLMAAIGDEIANLPNRPAPKPAPTKDPLS